MKLKIKQIRLDGDTQSRDAINITAVDEYTESILNGDQFPPLEVFHDGVYYWLVDGFHRISAYQKAKIDEVDVIIHKGTIRDAEKYSLGVNDRHGIQRSKETKRKIALKALNDLEWSELSDREIGRICKLSNGFIHNVRKSMNIERPKEKLVNTKHGNKTKMDISNIGKKVNPVEILAPVEEPTDDHDQDIISELSSLNEELHAENVALNDKHMILSGNDQEIADEIAGLRKQIVVLEKELSSVKNTRDELQAKNAELVKTVNYWRKRAEKLGK